MSRITNSFEENDEKYFIENDLIIMSFEISNYLKIKIKK